MNKLNNVLNFFIKYGIKIIAVISILIGIFSIFILAYFRDLNVYNQSEKVDFNYSFGIVNVLISLVILFLIWVITKKIFKKVKSIYLLIAISLVFLIVFFLWIHVLQLKTDADQDMVHQIAIFFVNGDISFHSRNYRYLDFYPYQFGIIYFLSILYRIFGIHFTVLQYFNAICSISNAFLLYFISKKIFKDEMLQKILVIFISFFNILWMFFNTHVYGNIFGLTLSLLSILFILNFFENNKWYNAILSGIFISLSCIMKSNYKIFLCGILLTLFIHVLQKIFTECLEKNFKENLKIIIKNISFILLFFLGYFIINLLYTPFFNEKTNNSKGIPMANYIYMGISESEGNTNGWYNSTLLNTYYNSNSDYDESTKNAIALAKERFIYLLKNPKEFIKFYGEKLASTWLNPTFQTAWCCVPGDRLRFDQDYAEYIQHHKLILDIINGDIYKYEEKLFNSIEIIVFIFAGIGIFTLEKKSTCILLPIIFIGGFLFHIIWETKSIYVIQYYFLLLPYASLGITKLFNSSCFRGHLKKQLNDIFRDTLKKYECYHNTKFKFKKAI